MTVIQKREQQRDGNGINVECFNFFNDLVDFILREWNDDIPLRVNPFGDFKSSMAGHQDGGWVLEHIVEISAR